MRDFREVFYAPLQQKPGQPRQSLFTLQYNSLYVLWMKAGDRENCVQGG